MPNVVPEKSLNFTVYADGGELLGVAEGALPGVDFMTSEVKGAGIAGVIDSPGMGQMNSMTMELTWRTITRDFARLLAPVGHVLDMYAAHLNFDAGNGQYRTSQIHAYIRGISKNCEPGKLAVSESSETKTTFEIYYMKLEIDGIEYLEVDKYNFIFRVNGVDYMSEVRRALGK